MRGSARLLATVKSAAKYLEPNTPTGLTGLTTHPAPRPALIYTYRQTLKALTSLPSSSVYRHSAEAFTKQRLVAVEETIPQGFDAWKERILKQINDSPAAYSKFKNDDGTFSYEKLNAARPEPWDGHITTKQAQQEGTNNLKEAERKRSETVTDINEVDSGISITDLPSMDELEVEPALTSDQISSIETKIGAGLIEEVIQVAEGELELVHEMLKARPWDTLEEPAPTGQWVYFERGDTV